MTTDSLHKITTEMRERELRNGFKSQTLANWADRIEALEHRQLSAKREEPLNEAAVEAAAIALRSIQRKDRSFDDVSLTQLAKAAITAYLKSTKSR